MASTKTTNYDNTVAAAIVTRNAEQTTATTTLADTTRSLPPLLLFLLPLLLCLFFLLLVFGLFHFLSSDSTDAGRRTSTQPYRPPLRILPDVPAIYIHSTYIHVFIYT